jgi:hypothetical protein
VAFHQMSQMVLNDLASGTSENIANKENFHIEPNL